MNRMEFLMYIIDRIQKRISVCSQFVSYDGRLIDTVFSSLSTFIMSCLLLYIGIIEQIDKYRRHIFWRGKDLKKKSPFGSTGLNMQTKRQRRAWSFKYFHPKYMSYLGWTLCGKFIIIKASIQILCNNAHFGGETAWRFFEFIRNMLMWEWTMATP